MSTIGPQKDGWEPLRTKANEVVIPALNARTLIAGQLILISEQDGGAVIALDSQAIQAMIDNAITAAFF